MTKFDGGIDLWTHIGNDFGAQSASNKGVPLFEKPAYTVRKEFKLVALFRTLLNDLPKMEYLCRPAVAAF